MSKENKEPLRVVGGVIWRAGRILAARRASGRAHAGWWEFPGGKVEPGESDEQALLRELEEELTIRAHDPVFLRRVVHTYPTGPVELLFFEIRHFEGEPVSAEGQGLCWITPAEGLKLPFLPPDQPVLQELAARAGEGRISCIL